MNDALEVIAGPFVVLVNAVSELVQETAREIEEDKMTLKSSYALAGPSEGGGE